MAARRSVDQLPRRQARRRPAARRSHLGRVPGARCGGGAVITLLHGDCRDVLTTLPEQCVQCVVTSPPYFQARDYGCDGQIGLEETPAVYVDALLAVFRAVHRVLREDGCLWVNIGDCYAQDTKWGGRSGNKNTSS